MDKERDESGSASVSAERLLREREARGLWWSMAARLIFIVVGAAVSIPTSNNLQGRIASLSLISIAVLVLAHNFRLVRKRKRLLFVGRTNMAYDILLIVVLPLTWYWSIGGSAQVPASFNAKNDLSIVVVVFVAVNALALRPLYPALVALVGMATLSGFGIQAALDPRVQWTGDNLQHVLGPRIKAAFIVWDVLAVGLVGLFLTALAVWARRMVRDLVELEAANQRILEAQAAAVLEAKMEGLASVVAGIAHELNTPLGVMLSACETSGRAAHMVGEATLGSELGERVTHAVKVIDDNGLLVRRAAARMQELVGSLAAFSRLDEADIEDMDVAQGLELALGLVAPTRRRGIEVRRDYQDATRVRVRSRAIHQVFLTLLENAHDAMDGAGELTLRVLGAPSAVRVEIRDTGPGMDAARLRTLFDLRFSARRGRMGMGLGLPNARRIVESHRGRIDVASTPGVGTTVLVSLPAGGVP